MRDVPPPWSVAGAWCLCTWLLSCALGCPRAAAESDVVRLSMADCASASGSEIAKLVGLELTPRLTIVLDDSQPATIRASLRCDGTRALIRVDDAARAAPLELSLALADTRVEARARLLALAVAELIATCRLEPDAVHKPPPPPAALEAPARSRSAETESAFSLWLAAGALRAFEPASWSPAFGLGAAQRFGLLALTGDLSWAWGSQRDGEALVRHRLLALSLAPALDWSAGDFSVGLGVGLRAGYAQLIGTPRTAGLHGGQLSGIYLTPVLQSALQWRLFDAWQLRLALEAGYVVKPLRGLDADRAALIELRGWYASTLLGIAWTP